MTDHSLQSFVEPPAEELLYTRADPDDWRLGGLVRPVALEELPTEEWGMVIVGVPDDRGIAAAGGRPGAAQGPDEIRRAFYKMTPGEHNQLGQSRMADVGNIRRLESVEDTLDRAELVMTWLLRTVPGRLLVLGGGHDIAYAHFSALIENTPDTRRTGIINIDAHFDVRPVKDKITSGTPFWRLLEKNDERFRGHELVEFGIQSHMAAPAHRRYLEQRGATIHMLRDSGPEGHLRVFKVAVDALAKRAHTIGVSFDMDAVRMSDAKGASAPSATGLSALDAIRISEAVGADRRIRTYGIYETSPPLDDGSAVRLAAQMCFHYALGIAKPER